MAELAPGQIITFYSYKGGTGRSMALANVACLLSQKKTNEQKILMIDWDLEAPGLHRFFIPHIQGSSLKTFESQLGLIDLFYEMQNICSQDLYDNEHPDKFFDDLKLEKYFLGTNIDSLYLMPAGKFDNSYPTRVALFNWESFFNKNPGLISAFAKYLSDKFNYVLIDSRTGFTDISSICTALMPERLVVVFTPNQQSLSGAIDQVKKSTDYRKQSDDVRPLIVFPLISRVEPAEPDLRKDWRFGTSSLIGYQPQFEKIFEKVYELAECDLTSYFDNVQIQHMPKYAYGEEIAVLSERVEERLSIAKSYENFANLLVESDGPWVSSEPIIYIDKRNGGIFFDAENQIHGDIVGRNVIKGEVSNVRRRVFIAHSSMDKSTVRELYQKLSTEEWIDPWLDEEKLLPGQDWDVEIKRAIENSDAVIVCLSKSSVTSEGYVQRDLRYSLDNTLNKNDGTVIIPIRLEDCNIPTRLSSWQYVDYFPDNRRDIIYDRLLQSLKNIKIISHEEPKDKYKPKPTIRIETAKDELSPKTTDKSNKNTKPVINTSALSGPIVLTGLIILMVLFCFFLTPSGIQMFIKPPLTPTQVEQPVLAVFNVEGAVTYYSDPLLQLAAGKWDLRFYICTQFSNTAITSYKIAEKSEDCLNNIAIGWVNESMVTLANSDFPDAQITLVAPDAKQCQDGIDNDGDGKIDYPVDPKCISPSDNSEAELLEPTSIAIGTSTATATLTASPGLPSGMDVQLVTNTTNGKSPLKVNLNASGSFFRDSKGDIYPCGLCNYTWYIYSGSKLITNVERSAAETFIFTFEANGDYRVVVKVCRGQGDIDCGYGAEDITVR